MRPGDLVRFQYGSRFNPAEAEFELLGLLIEYHKWEKMATILYDGKLLRVAADRTQIAQRSDVPSRVTPPSV